jgi:hypothetical protein
MHVLERYSRSTPIFTNAASGKHVKCKCDFVLYVDPPKSVQPQLVAPQSSAALPVDTAMPDRPVTSHVMQQVGSVSGAPAQFLLDFGAEGYNYISTAFCRRIGLALRPPSKEVVVKGVQDSSGVVDGECTAVMSLGTLKMSVKFIAIELPEAFDVFMGDVWLKQMQAKLDYATRTCCAKRQ